MRKPNRLEASAYKETSLYTQGLENTQNCYNVNLKGMMKSLRFDVILVARRKFPSLE